MAEDLRVRADRSALVIIDVQERLAPAMPYAGFDLIARNIARLVSVAGRFKIPVALSEQYPKGLGPTVPLLKEAVARLQPAPVYIEKITFSLADEPLFQSFLGNGRRTLILVGMETHVCVYQTVRGLAERGYAVHVPVDAVISRAETDHNVGLDLIERAGGVRTTTETVIFDLLERADTEHWKALSRLLK